MDAELIALGVGAAALGVAATLLAQRVSGLVRQLRQLEARVQLLEQRGEWRTAAREAYEQGGRPALSVLVDEP